MCQRGSDYFLPLISSDARRNGTKVCHPLVLGRLSKRSGIDTTFHVPDDFERLSRDAELVLFRVLQESLTNVQRHSGSKTADIHISRTDNAVTLLVTDRGKGLPAAVLEQGTQDWMGSLGVGLRGMSERLQQLGAPSKSLPAATERRCAQRCQFDNRPALLLIDVIGLPIRSK